MLRVEPHGNAVRRAGGSIRAAVAAVEFVCSVGSMSGRGSCGRYAWVDGGRGGDHLAKEKFQIMTRPLQYEFSRRERQIMDAVYALRSASAQDVVARIGEPDAYHSVRVTLGVLERKGYLKHRKDGNRNIYSAVVPADSAKKSAMRHLVRTFFGGSPSRAILAFLDQAGSRLTAEELEEIAGRLDAWQEPDE